MNEKFVYPLQECHGCLGRGYMKRHAAFRVEPMAPMQINGIDRKCDMCDGTGEVTIRGDGDERMSALKAVRFDLETEKAAHKFTEFTLQELLKERGLPTWLSEALLYRDDLMQMLREATYDNDDGCCGRAEPYHDRTCEHGLWLRRIGGPKETQRQVEAAYDLWEYDENYRKKQAARLAALTPEQVAADDAQTRVMENLMGPVADRMVEQWGLLRQLGDAVPRSNAPGENQNANDDVPDNGR